VVVGLGLALLAGVSACGRSQLFSTRRSCAPTDPTCQAEIDGGAGVGGNADGGKGGTGGRRDGGPNTCPTGNREICGNKTDDDCNGLADCADPACFGDPTCFKPGQEICNNGLDDDGDGLIDCADPDCMGSLACRPTMGTEICDNGIDDNGDHLVDCADPQCTTFPGCLTVNCTADTDFGTIAQHGASVSRNLDTRGSTNAYATCAPAGGHGRVGRFTLTAQSDVRVDFSQAAGGAHVVSVFRAGANQACDRNSVGCMQVGDAAKGTQTFPALSAGVYWLIVESYPGTEGATTVVLSTGSATKMEICGNGIDDDGNGLTDCQDLACANDPSCANSECKPDINLGTLVVDAPAKPASADLTVAADRYRPTCAGNVPGGDVAVAFTLPQAAGIEVAFQQTGHSIFALFNAPAPGEACDAHQVACTFEDFRSSAIAYSEASAGNYILIVKATSLAEAGVINLRISAFSNRKVEVCGNGIDDDGNGLIDCADPACFGVGMCMPSGCTPDVNLGSFSPGTVQATTLDTRAGSTLYQTPCSRGTGKERIVRFTLTQPMAIGIDCTQTGSHVLELTEQLQPLDACNANEIDCADPTVLPFGCGYSIPDLQPGTYNLLIQAFEAGDEGTVMLTLDGEMEVVREICNNGIDDDGDGFIDCADRKCVTSPLCAKFACRPDQSVGLLPLDGTPVSAIVQTTMAGDDETHTMCVSAAGGQDAVVDFQTPAVANVTLTWAQVGNHDFALYSNDGQLLSCEAGTSIGCVTSGGVATGSHVFMALPQGSYHLVVDADAPGKEGGVVLQLSGTP
jgi:hypothetical protein